MRHLQWQLLQGQRLNLHYEEGGDVKRMMHHWKQKSKQHPCIDNNRKLRYEVAERLKTWVKKWSRKLLLEVLVYLLSILSTLGLLHLLLLLMWSNTKRRTITTGTTFLYVSLIQERYLAFEHLLKCVYWRLSLFPIRDTTTLGGTPVLLDARLAPQMPTAQFVQLLLKHVLVTICNSTTLVCSAGTPSSTGAYIFTFTLGTPIGHLQTSFD